MSLVSSLFLVFVAAALLLYYVLPKSFRFWVILAASLAFSAFLGFYTLLFVLVSAVLCYVGGMGTWNSYVWPNLVANEPEFRLISNGLRSSSFKDPITDDPEYGYQMAASILVTVPLFLLFIFFRKYIMKGVGRAGIKG